MVEGQLPRIATILADEPVAQEKVEPGEGRMFGRLHILSQRDDARDRHRPCRAVHFARIVGDDVHPFQKDRLDGGLPGPQAQGVVAERRIVGVQHQRGTTVRMSHEVRMIHGPAQAPVSWEDIPETAARPCRTQRRKRPRVEPSPGSITLMAASRDDVMTTSSATRGQESI